MLRLGEGHEERMQRHNLEGRCISPQTSPYVDPTEGTSCRALSQECAVKELTMGGAGLGASPKRRLFFFILYGLKWLFFLELNGTSREFFRLFGLT